MMMPLPTTQPMKTENKMIPDLDSVTLNLKKGKGISDSFFARLTISVPMEDVDSNRVASIRIFRATISNRNLTRPLSDLSLKGIGIISSRPASSRQKTDDTLSHIARRLSEDNIPNALSIFNPIDRFIGVRTTAKPAKFVVTDNIDKSVSENPQFMNARRLQDPKYGLSEYENFAVIGSNDSGDKDLGEAHLEDVASKESKFSMVVKNNNGSGFKQIFTARPSGFKMKSIGKRYYLSFDDESIVFGKQYQYFVVTVDKNMIQSNRSAIATMNVDGIRIPARPTNVLSSSNGNTVTLFSTCDDHFVERFEIWKKDKEISAAKNEFVVYKSENGYSLVDDIVNPDHASGASWTDRKVIPGHSYDYRVYSVDVFGNKSESPFEISITVPDTFDGDDKSLVKPALISEVDSKTQKIKITMRCSDPRVRKLRLERRDMTIGQEAFTVPSESSRIIMGAGKFKHGSGVHGERIEDTDNISMWNGWFDNLGGDINFVDYLTTFDRTYQYRVHGIDERGNRTSYAYSSPTLVYRKPMINAPVKLSSSFITGSTGDIQGVNISWSSSSLDISPEDKMGSQSTLADTAIRTLYQVERQKEGERWLLFNMTENEFYVDKVQIGNSKSPEYRPPFLEMNNVYNYRVQAVVSGGFISNKTEQISVYVGNPIAQPLNFTLRTPDPRIRPFYVMLNWDTHTQGGVVDRWEIERVEINNHAASRMNLKNQKEISALKFEKYRTVFKESSRFHTFWSDAVNGTFRSDLMPGQHHFMDSKIVFGNTYFYRICSVDTRGNRSPYAYKAIRITYSSFERLLEEVLSKEERNKLSANQIPMRPSPSITPDEPLDSMSLNPTFSTPRSTPSQANTTRRLE
jgi:hypothetical protein